MLVGLRRKRSIRCVDAANCSTYDVCRRMHISHLFVVLIRRELDNTNFELLKIIRKLIEILVARTHWPDHNWQALNAVLATLRTKQGVGGNDLTALCKIL